MPTRLPWLRPPIFAHACRYRNFRTMTSPRPVQFACLAVDPGGEVVAAGTVDTFQVRRWGAWVVLNPW